MAADGQRWNNLKVVDAMVLPALRLAPSTLIREAAARVEKAGLPGAPVVDSEGRLLGVLSTAEIARVEPDRHGEVLVQAAMNARPLVFEPSATLDEALEAMTTAEASWAPVVSGLGRLGQHLVGALAIKDIVNAYRSGQRESVRQLRGVTGLGPNLIRDPRRAETPT